LSRSNLKKNNKNSNNKSRFPRDYFNLEKCYFNFRNYFNGISVVLIYSSALLLLFLSYSLLKIDNAWASPTGEIHIPNYMVTTRDGSDPPRGVSGSGYDGSPLGDINQLRRDCPEEIAIFVHGWHIDDNEAKERLDRVRMSLIENNYIVPLVGFSWPSDVTWEEAQIVAKQNGPKLAHFILDYVTNCKPQDVNVRLIGHSLGARVILSTLDDLHNNLTWTNEDFKILSVHLLGAAVDNEEVSKNPADITEDSTNDPIIKSAYGEAVEGEVIRFYNLYNPQDNILQRHPFSPTNLVYEIYPFFESDLALGQAGRQQQSIMEVDKVSTPPYYDINVRNQIEPGTDSWN
jgi:Alpha/beta hydrolase of unknown function (DUF900)